MMKVNLIKGGKEMKDIKYMQVSDRGIGVFVSVIVASLMGLLVVSLLSGCGKEKVTPTNPPVKPVVPVVPITPVQPPSVPTTTISLNCAQKRIRFFRRICERRERRINRRIDRRARRRARRS